MRIRCVINDLLLIQHNYSLLPGVPGPELNEMLHHCSWAYEKSCAYIGCEDIIKKAMDNIFSLQKESFVCEVDAVDSCALPLPFKRVKLCVVGKSGIIYEHLRFYTF